MLKHLFTVFSFSSTILLAACGGNSGGSAPAATPLPDPTPAPLPLSGVFVDSPVANVDYRTDTLSGVTSALGEYDYLPGETVVFSIGSVVFPPVIASGRITPLDLAGTTNTRAPQVVNIIRLLQSLDIDGNPDNGISITPLAKSNATESVDFNVSVEAFSASQTVLDLLAGGGQDSMVTELVSRDSALAHLEEQLMELDVDLPSAQIEGAWVLAERPQVSVGGSDLSLLLLLADGTYYMAESNEVNEGDGFESGTYTFVDGLISATTLIDTNENVGFSAVEEAAELSIYLLQNSFGFETMDSRESGEYLWARATTIEGGISGAWLIEDKTTLFLFLDDGRYIGFQSQEGNGFNGFEYGNYTLSAGLLTISTTDNADGEALFCDAGASEQCSDRVFNVGIEDDELSFYFGPEQDPVVFDRQSMPESTFSVDLTQEVINSRMVNSACPDTTGGFDYMFTANSVSLTGSDRWNDCSVEPDSTIMISASEINELEDFVFNCAAYPICTETDFNKVVSGLDSDQRSFVAHFSYNLDSRVLTVIKHLESEVFTETFTFE